MLDYRRGEAEKAADWCRRVLAYPESSPVENETAHAVLALAAKRLNQSAAARRQLNLAQEVVAEDFPSGWGNRRCQ